jgi:hypothetical protein
MDQTLQVVLQGGALGILIYLIIWATQKGFPGFMMASERIAKSIDQNTAKLTDVERWQILQNQLLGKLVDRQPLIGEETMTLKAKLKSDQG